jgi:antitoxin (DNA-binding transcriptional repressor) of toxin-antitoxin stability system
MIEHTIWLAEFWGLEMMRFISITEARRHLDKYIEICQEEDVIITRYGHPIALLRGFGRTGETIMYESDNQDKSAGSEPRNSIC